MKLKRQLMMVLVASMVGIIHAQEHDHEQAKESVLDSFIIDAARSQIGFVVSHLEFLNVRGVFIDYDATLRMAGNDITTLELEGTIQAASIYTGRGILDDNLHSVAYFEVETYPEITFVSSGVVRNGSDYALTGHITIKGVTQDVTLPVTRVDPVSDPRGNTRIRVELGGELNRHAFGVAHDGMPDRFISDVVRLDVQLTAIKQ